LVWQGGKTDAGRTATPPNYIPKHGIDFVGINQFFAGETMTILDDRFHYSDTRFITVGRFKGRVVVVAHRDR
jgi:uncharacterized protein